MKPRTQARNYPEPHSTDGDEGQLEPASLRCSSQWGWALRRLSQWWQSPASPQPMVTESFSLSERAGLVSCEPVFVPEASVMARSVATQGSCRAVSASPRWGQSPGSFLGQKSPFPAIFTLRVSGVPQCHECSAAWKRCPSDISHVAMGLCSEEIKREECNGLFWAYIIRADKVVSLRLALKQVCRLYSSCALLHGFFLWWTREGWSPQHSTQCNMQ